MLKKLANLTVVLIFVFAMAFSFAAEIETAQAAGADCGCIANCGCNLVVGGWRLGYCKWQKCTSPDCLIRICG